MIILLKSFWVNMRLPYPKWFIVSHGVSDVAILYLLWKDYKSQTRQKEAQASISSLSNETSAESDNIAEKVAAFYKYSKTAAKPSTQAEKANLSNPVDYEEIYKSNRLHLSSAPEQHDTYLENSPVDKSDIEDEIPTFDERENEIETLDLTNTSNLEDETPLIQPNSAEGLDESDDDMSLDDEDEEVNNLP